MADVIEETGATAAPVVKKEPAAPKKEVPVEDKIKKELMAQFKKEFPESPLEVMDESDFATIPGWIDTGSYALNWVVSKDIFRGFPKGRVVLMTGDSGSCKSLIALSMMREPTIDQVIYLDSEGGGVTTDFAELLGVDPKKILYSPIDTMEEFTKKISFIVDNIEKNNVKNRTYLVIVDSISMLSSSREQDDASKSEMGAKAKELRSFFRRYKTKMQRLNMCMVMTGHLTQKIGAYGDPTTVAGGSILQYMPSAEVRFSRNNKDSETETSAVGTSMTRINAKMVKSRFGTLGKRINFDFDTDKGLDRFAGITDILTDYNILIPAQKDFEKQIADKKIPNRSGWFCFVPWDTGRVGALQAKIVADGLSTSGKFREKDVVEFCKAHPWFLNEIAAILREVDSFDTGAAVVDEETEGDDE
jgi:RecA/RadA recombinase